MSADLIIIGAGPASLTAAYQALQQGIKPLVLEAKICSVKVKNKAGDIGTLTAAQVISPMPITGLIQQLNPPATPELLNASTQLQYRAFLIVALSIAVVTEVMQRLGFADASEVEDGVVIRQPKAYSIYGRSTPVKIITKKFGSG